MYTPQPCNQVYILTMQPCLHLNHATMFTSQPCNHVYTSTMQPCLHLNHATMFTSQPCNHVYTSTMQPYLHLNHATMFTPQPCLHLNHATMHVYFQNASTFRNLLTFTNSKIVCARPEDFIKDGFKIYQFQLNYWLDLDFFTHMR